MQYFMNFITIERTTIFILYVFYLSFYCIFAKRASSVAHSLARYENTMKPPTTDDQTNDRYSFLSYSSNDSAK